MNDLIILTLDNGDTLRCSSLDEAKSRVSASTSKKGTVEITPEGGGNVITLEINENQEAEH